MTHFVMVAGAWLGAWVWGDVARLLAAAGHGAHPLTLSGVAERRGVPAGQETHVRDIVDEVVRRDLHDVVLVGHSYSGIPVGQAAERIGGRLSRVVFVDSEVPVDGESFVSGWWEGPERLAAVLAAHDGRWPPPTAADLAGQGLSDAQIARLVAGATPHPGASLAEPATLTRPLGALPATYVKCLLDGPEPKTTVAELLTCGTWRRVDLDTGHWPMVSRPEELARVLLAAAAEGRG
ncbi:alpha/beta fold hydrolase [Streptomyces catenulae]|uniref:Alpha/beta hydrolase family protein n=1 Tax=Streptomyces catenulae TaxID=66875 RepID=A0ABV2YSX3_9ACTN|nr:alpha/beta hydrolase family protein [Streptomyces catenulae]